MKHPKNLVRAKGTVHGVWTKCLDCQKPIVVIEGFQDKCVCNECKLNPKGK